MRPRRLLVLLAVAACLAALTPVALAASKRITASGVGGVKIGMKHSTAQARGLVGRKRAGCELAGPGTRGARLRAPLKGSVDLTRTEPRRIKRIAVTGGATARGVGIGDTIADITAAYPKAKVDHSTDAMFLVTLVRIPKDGGGRIEFAVATDTKRVTLIGVPVVSFCE
jgi:hypothetical protein